MKLSLLTVALASTSIAVAGPTNKGKGNKGPKSYIQLISDGFGPASQTFARSLYQYEKGLPWTAELPQDKFIVGTIRTRSTDSLVTDSAASATAYSCGIKSYNAAIGVDTDYKPCGTNLEAAKAKGFNTALVTTSRVTHATPASWSAHVKNRDDEDIIASQQLGGYKLGRQVDILWGGGRGFFLPNTTGSASSRKDTRDLIAEAKAAGWSYVSNATEFNALGNGTKVTFPSLGLFTKSHMAFEIDRNATLEPSLKEMSIAALNALKKANKPFFIMIEGARIDHAGHSNDAAAHYRDIIAYQEAVEAVAKWVDENDQGKGDEPNILMVGTSDHECGGLTLGLQRPEDAEGEYLWYPDVVARATHSTEYLAADFLKVTANQTDDQKKTYMVDTIIKKGLGLTDFNQDEVQRALDLAKVKDSGLSLNIWLASLINWRAHLGWSTTGHSGTDVNLYYHEAPGYERTRERRLLEVKGNHENYWIANYTANWLGLDNVQNITNALNNGSYSWTLQHPDLANFTTALPKYHGGVAHVVPALPPKPARRAVRGAPAAYSFNDNLHILRDMADRSHRVGHAEL